VIAVTSETARGHGILWGRPLWRFRPNPLYSLWPRQILAHSALPQNRRQQRAASWLQPRGLRIPRAPVRSPL